MWTPYMIDIVLHHHTSHAPYERQDAPGYTPAMEKLVGMDVLFVTDDRRFATTDLGKALVEMWCNTPLPVKKYVDPRSEAVGWNESRTAAVINARSAQWPT